VPVPLAVATGSAAAPRRRSPPRRRRDGGAEFHPTTTAYTAHTALTPSHSQPRRLSRINHDQARTHTVSASALLFKP
jgi:hypothetical protein